MEESLLKPLLGSNSELTPAPPPRPPRQEQRAIEISCHIRRSSETAHTSA
ncbi:hypothetical protein WMF38_56675 [Sorangium sp. So ce118]